MLVLRWSIMLLAFQIYHKAFCARILGLFSAPLYSHQHIYQTMMKALADRGHEVTVVSPNPLKEPYRNYKDVDQSFIYEICETDFTRMNMKVPTPLQFVHTVSSLITGIAYTACEAQLKSPELQEFLRSYNSTFDLIINEKMAFLCLDGLVHHFGSPPTIAFTSYLPPTWLQDAVGNPYNPSYTINFAVGYTDKKSFWQRIMSTYFYLKIAYDWLYNCIPSQDKMFRKYFGPDPPPIFESDRNFSLLLYHGDWTVGYPQAHLPYVVHLRGIHIQRTPNPLPKDIQEFIDGAEMGVVFFSFGSNIDSRKLPDSDAQMILDSLGLLPQRVLLKWHTEELNNSAKNVKASKWFPQQDVLAHPNVKIFVSQCGIQSLQEAVYYAVPVLGIPFLQEQKLNAQKLVLEGAGLSLDLAELSEEKLIDSIGNILKDISFKKNMIRLSEVFKDEPQSSLERGIWWIEYVLRNNGTKHMNPAVKGLMWPQYLLTDVLALALCIFFICVKTAWYMLSIIKRVTGTISK